MWYLAALFWIALVVGIFWAYGRKRSRAGSKRAAELSALIADAKMNVRAAPNPQPVAAYPVPQTLAAATINSYCRRPRLLGQADALLYLLFRTGLPDHEVFANLTLADVIEPGQAFRGFEREQLARKLAQHRLNVVVCNKQLEVVAVVAFTPAAQADAVQTDGLRYIESCLNGAGIRFVRVDAAALPRHHQVRALVFGETTQGAA
jgi:hypothetical protein